jgi:hypothetical protein
MATLFDSHCHALNGEFHIWQLQEYEFDVMPVFPPYRYKARIRQPAQCGFKRKTFTFADMLLDFFVVFPDPFGPAIITIFSSGLLRIINSLLFILCRTTNDEPGRLPSAYFPAAMSSAINSACLRTVSVANRLSREGRPPATPDQGVVSSNHSLEPRAAPQWR